MGATIGQIRAYGRRLKGLGDEGEGFLGFWRLLKLF